MNNSAVIKIFRGFLDNESQCEELLPNDWERLKDIIIRERKIINSKDYAPLFLMVEKLFIVKFKSKCIFDPLNAVCQHSQNWYDDKGKFWPKNLYKYLENLIEEIEDNKIESFSKRYQHAILLSRYKEIKKAMNKFLDAYSDILHSPYYAFNQIHLRLKINIEEKPKINANIIKIRGKLDDILQRLNEKSV